MAACGESEISDTLVEQSLNAQPTVLDVGVRGALENSGDCSLESEAENRLAVEPSEL